MRRLSLYSAAVLLALAPAVQAEESDWPEFQKRMEQFSEESRAFLQKWMTELGPMLESLRDKIDDLSNYEAPEVLPNGDIIIRRKPDLPPEAAPDGPPAEAPQDQIDL